MYKLYRKFVICTFIVIGVFLIGFGIFLFFDETNTENPLKHIGIGVVSIIMALLAKRFDWIIVRW